MKNNRAILTLAASLLLISPPLFANAGLPMLMIAWPMMGAALIPIILIEWWSMRKSLPSLAPKRLFYATTLSNLFSTLVGIPLAWIFMVGFIFLGYRINVTIETTPILNVTLGAAWLAPTGEQLSWMIPVALLVLLIPFFWASYWLEAFVTKRFFKQEDRRLIKKAVFKANLFSYAFLASLILIYLIMAICKVKI
jgi:hypothetical protein